MLESMLPSELGMWIALYRLDPWGEQRADLRMGISASVLANVNRDSKQRAQPYRAIDFMPYVDRQASDPKELSRQLRAAFTPFSSKVK